MDFGLDGRHGIEIVIARSIHDFFFSDGDYVGLVEILAGSA